MFALTAPQTAALTALATRTGEATHVTARSLGHSAAALNSLVRKGLAERVDTYDTDMVTKGHYAITELGRHELTPTVQRPVHVEHETLEDAMAAVDFHGYETNNVGTGYTSNCYGEALTFGYSDDIEQYVLERDGEVIFTYDSPAMLLGFIAYARSRAYVDMRNEYAPLPMRLTTLDHFAALTTGDGIHKHIVNMYTCTRVVTITL